MQEPFLHIILCNLQLAKINATVGIFFFHHLGNGIHCKEKRQKLKKKCGKIAFVIKLCDFHNIKTQCLFL